MSLLKNFLIGLQALGLLFSTLLAVFCVYFMKRKSSNKRSASFIFFFTMLVSQAFFIFAMDNFFDYSDLFIKISLTILVIEGIYSFISPFLKGTKSKKIVHSLFWLIPITQTTGILDPVLHYLAMMELQVGLNTISVLSIVKAIMVCSILIWAGGVLSQYLEKKLEKERHLQPSMKIVLTKLVKTIILSFSIYFTMSILGIDLSVFSFFAGAMGVAIAFGLQNILSNFFCGFIILFDRSIKPGDIICIEEGKIYGVVHRLNARYVSIKTREGKEHLIPNQHIVTNKIENWSYSDPNIRIEIPFKMAFDSNLEEIELLFLEIANSVKRVLKSPAPSLRYVAIYHNIMELKLQLWIKDPQNGLSSLRSEIIFKVWKAFQKKGIKLPYPPLEIHNRFFTDSYEKNSSSENNYETSET